MGKVAIGRAVEHFIFHAQPVEQLWQYDAAHTVDGVKANLEMCLSDGLGIHQLQCQHAVDVAAVETVVVGIMSQMVHIGIFKIFLFGNVEHHASLLLVQEFPLVVKQFQGVPLSGIMTGSDDDAAIRTSHLHGKFCGGSGGQTYVYHVVAIAHQGAAHHILHHLS